MGTTDLNKLKREAEQSAAAWFLTLESARQANDFELAAKAKRQLEKLGVKVSYKPARGNALKGRVDNG